MRIINLDHHFALPGGVGRPWDRACVLSTTETERHILTGEDQPKRLFLGTLEECHAFVDTARREAIRIECERPVPFGC